MIFKPASLLLTLLSALLGAATLVQVDCVRRNVLSKTYGLNDVGLRMRATWIDPFATDLDPRRLLLFGADEIDRFGPGNEVARDMRALWDDPFSPKYNFRDLLRRGADEIDRLESEHRFPKNKEQNVR